MVANVIGVMESSELKLFLGFKGNYEYIAYVICSKCHSGGFKHLKLKDTIILYLSLAVFLMTLSLVAIVLSFFFLGWIGVFVVLPIGIMLTYVPLQYLSVYLGELVVYRININSYSSTLDNLEKRFIQKTQVSVGKTERNSLLKDIVFSRNNGFLESESEQSSIKRLFQLVPILDDEIAKLGYINEGIVLRHNNVAI